MKSQAEQKPKISIIRILGFLLLLWILSLIIASFFGLTMSNRSYGNVAVIKIYGTITSTSSDGFFDEGVNANDVISLLDEAEKDPTISAVVLDINSGGGSAVGSDEIGKKLRSMNKTTVAVIREVGASGAYWIASNTDHIIANRMSLVGSIGVTGSYIEFAGLLKRYNMTYRSITSGEYKDAGSPFKELSQKDEEYLQKLVDELHGYFVEEVAKNRNLPEETVNQLATGEVFSGKKGLEMGLVDELGGFDEASAYLTREFNITVDYTYFEEYQSFSEFLQKLVSRQSFYVGRGIGSYLNTNDPIIRT